MTKASRTLAVVIGVVVTIVVIIVLGVILRVSLAGQSNVARAESDAVASFPVPQGSAVVLPLTTGNAPPSATQSWRTSGTLDQVCGTWRELFRAWVDPNVEATGGEVQPGVSCTFAGQKNGMNATLRVASYGTQGPEATLSIVGAEENSP